MSQLLDEAVAEIDRLTADETSELVTLDDAVSIEPNPTYFEIDDDAVLIYWGGYEYDILLSEITSPLFLLGRIEHISEKTWPLMTAERIGCLISAVCDAKGWNPHTGVISSPDS